MAEVLRFFVQYEAVLYFVIGLGGILYLYRFWLAWQEVSSAVYELEREASRTRLNQAAVTLFALLIFAFIIFVMVTFVATTLPAQSLLATPTLDLTIAASGGPTPSSRETVSVSTATPLPTVSVDPEACIPESINISAPESGDTLRGAVEVRGTVDVPNTPEPKKNSGSPSKPDVTPSVMMCWWRVGTPRVCRPVVTCCS